MIKLVSFDLEGTIINLEPVHHQAHILTATEVGLKISLEDCFDKLPHFIGGPDEEVAREIAELARKPDKKKSILRSKCDHYNQLLKGAAIELRPGFLKILDWLRANNFKIAIGSLTHKNQAKVLLEKSGLSRIIDKENIVLKEDVKELKPAPYVWIETAKRANADCKEQLVFEDSPNGIIAAKKAGSIAIGIPIYNKPVVITKLLNAGAIRIFMDWREINIAPLIENLNQGFS